MTARQQYSWMFAALIVLTIGCGDPNNPSETKKKAGQTDATAGNEGGSKPNRQSAVDSLNADLNSTNSKSNEVNLKAMPAGLHQQTLALSNGKTLRFTIGVPDGYSAKSPCPLVVALHYGGRVTPFYGAGMVRLVAPPFRDLNAIIVAPDVIEPGWQNDTNENAVLGLMDNIAKSYSIDSSKVVLTGYSVGGHMAVGTSEDGIWIVFQRLSPSPGEPTATLNGRPHST